MKQGLVVGLAAVMLVTLGCNDQSKTEEVAEVQAEPKLETLEQKVSYIFGLNLGQQFKQDQIDLDAALMTLAIEDVYAEREPRISQDEVQAIMTAFQQKQEAKRNDAFQGVADANKAEGETFLAANATKEGVLSTESGLQYKVITEGKGPKPSADDKVTVHYRGTLIDGTEFDSSHKRGEPVSFPVSGVISGWTEALQLMPEGSKWELYIPSDLAYGPGGTGREIGPNATLIFEVELLAAKADTEE